MHASGTFTVKGFTPLEPPLSTGPETATAVSVAKLEKHFAGEICGHSTTVFTYALAPASDSGGYVAMESFEGSLHGRSGTFNFTHSATTAGADRNDESLTIIPSSGTGELAGISGGGAIRVDSDGIHHLRLDYRLGSGPQQSGEARQSGEAQQSGEQHAQRATDAADAERALPQVIVLNGGSSSGKSSVARALQEILPGIWLTFGVDTFIDALPGRGDSPRSGISYGADGSVSVTAEYRRLETAWYSAMRTLVQAGAHIILDEVLLSGGAGQRHLLSAFEGSSLLWVGVRCDPDVAADREASRGDRVPGMARLQASRVHDGVRYDIEVDTTTRSPGACAQLLADFVTAAG
ncbi:DUF3224 domain-containing protein [Microbacterium sp. ARD32]|uniref:phosphotransferase-like protein n=1 Tax=Microbacterium sp. ARD32 TaxID=2962577 RepID=UPI0028820669|nr:DUF3224 domain-containing protein [Microbacterium sp. ARD32]MDT0157585.1 DUF3224 domain-containing protein [Microbacterium sp. ARD32]